MLIQVLDAAIVRSQDGIGKTQAGKGIADGEGNADAEGQQFQVVVYVAADPGAGLGKQSLQKMESKSVDTFISQYDAVHNMAWNALTTDMRYYQSKAK